MYNGSQSVLALTCVQGCGGTRPNHHLGGVANYWFCNGFLLRLNVGSIPTAPTKRQRKMSMQKSPDKPLHREHEAKNCWECDKMVTKSGKGCERPYRRSMKRRGKRRFEKEIEESLVEVEDDLDIYHVSGDEYENWLEYRLGSAIDDGWLDD